MFLFSSIHYQFLFSVKTHWWKSYGLRKQFTEIMFYENGLRKQFPETVSGNDRYTETVYVNGSCFVCFSS